MDSLTPFVRHSLPDAPGEAGAAEAGSSQNSPPLGKPPLAFPPSQPDTPGVQLPPPAGGVPMTDGTPAPCAQKNAASFLRGSTPGVMAQYGQGLFGAALHTHSARPAPNEDAAGVRELVEWREQAPYG